MNTIKVEKTKLLEILRKNRTEHRQIFEEALEGYRKIIVGELERRLDNARKGKKIDLYFSVVEPVDQTKDYDRAIAMLEMDLNNEVELEETDFQRYVLDDWSWQNHFLASNSLYSGTAASKLNAAGN